MRPRTSKVRVRSGGQPADSTVVVRGIFPPLNYSLANDVQKNTSLGDEYLQKEREVKGRRELTLLQRERVVAVAELTTAAAE